jgi:hypothetical protein
VKTFHPKDPGLAEQIVRRTLSRLEYKQLVKKMEQLASAGQLSTAEENMWNEVIEASGFVVLEVRKL